jgi:hypothetical protein
LSSKNTYRHLSTCRDNGCHKAHNHNMRKEKKRTRDRVVTTCDGKEQKKDMAPASNSKFITRDTDARGRSAAILSWTNAGGELSPVNVDVKLVNAVLSPDESRSLLAKTKDNRSSNTHRMRPSSLHDKPAVLSGEGGTSKKPESATRVPRMALSSHRLMT